MTERLRPTMIHLHDPYVLQLIEALSKAGDKLEELEKDLSQARAGCYACEPVALENERLRAALELAMDELTGEAWLAADMALREDEE